jgi:hypothetical protein
MSSTIFPTLRSPNWKMTRTPTWSTIVRTSSTGNRRRVPLRTKPLWRWTLKNAVLQSADTIADLQTIQDFYNARAGQLDSFLWQDPEPDSISPDPDIASVLGSYWPVAFTVDSIDFERFAYQLWKCGTVSFAQIAAGPAELWTMGEFDMLWTMGGYGTLVHGPITSAVLNVVTAYTVGPSYAAFGTVTVGAVGILGFTSSFVNQNTSWPKRTDTAPLTGAALANLRSGAVHVQFWIDGTLFGDTTPPCKLFVYDSWIDVVYRDTSTRQFRPTTSAYVHGTTGDVLNPGLAIDNDATSFATVERGHFSGLGISPILQIGKYQ